jgi:hypothetical protein
MTKSRDLRDARCAYKSLRNGRALLIRDQSNTKLVINMEHKWMRPHCRIFVTRLYPLYTRLKLHTWVVANFITILFTFGNNNIAYSWNTPLKVNQSVQHYVIKFVSDSPDTPISSTIKTDSHDITEILFKVALNIINQHD